jgi:hypothetical protein
MDAGRHVLELAEDPRMIPGIYLLRLSQGSRAVNTKIALLR